MIFGSRQDQRFNFNLGGHKIDICTEFKYLGVILNRNRHFHQTKKHNEFVILIFQLICSCIYLPKLFYLCHYMVVKYGALKIAKLLKIYIMMSLERLLT